MIYSEYETIYIVRPEMPEDAHKALSDKVAGIIEKGSGIVLTLDDWGKRKLAYPIRKNNKGHYVYFNYVGPSDLIAELERQLRIDDQLLRFLTVKLGVDVDVATRQSEAAEENAKRAEARAAAAAAAAEAAAEEERRRAAAEAAAAVAAAAAAVAAAAAEAEAAAAPAEAETAEETG